MDLKIMLSKCLFNYVRQFCLSHETPHLLHTYVKTCFGFGLLPCPYRWFKSLPKSLSSMWRFLIIHYIACYLSFFLVVPFHSLLIDTYVLHLLMYFNNYAYQIFEWIFEWAGIQWDWWRNMTTNYISQLMSCRIINLFQLLRLWFKLMLSPYKGHLPG